MLSGNVITELYPKGRSDHTKAFLRRLLEEVEGRIMLIWYRARWHASQAIQALIRRQERLEVLLLPKRSPEANPIEDLWQELKKHRRG